MSENTVAPSDLGVISDPGCDWHPRPDKTEVYNADGDLADLTDAEVAEHERKPEAADQADAGQSLAAEESAQSPNAEV